MLELQSAENTQIVINNAEGFLWSNKSHLWEMQTEGPHTYKALTSRSPTSFSWWRSRIASCLWKWKEKGNHCGYSQSLSISKDLFPGGKDTARVPVQTGWSGIQHRPLLSFWLLLGRDDLFFFFFFNKKYVCNHFPIFNWVMVICLFLLISICSLYVSI